MNHRKTNNSAGRGASIADLTLTDFRIELADFAREHPQRLNRLPLGTFAVTIPAHDDHEIAPGVIFCLRAAGEAAKKPFEPGYPLAPHYLVHVGDDGATLLGFTQAKQILDRLRRLCVGRDAPDAAAVARFDHATRGGQNMIATQRLLAAAVAARRQALVEHAELTRRIAVLRSQAERETQIARRVELNLEIKRLEAALAEAVARL